MIKMDSGNAALKIHISSETKMLLETVGGGDFVVKKRGSLDLSSKGVVDTFWLTPNAASGDDLHNIARKQSNEHL